MQGEEKKRKWRSDVRTTGIRVARFFSGPNKQKEKNIPNEHKLYQTAIKYTKWP
jgi:hypothetical protein